MYAKLLLDNQGILLTLGQGRRLWESKNTSASFFQLVKRSQISQGNIQKLAGSIKQSLVEDVLQLLLSVLLDAFSKSLS